MNPSDSANLRRQKLLLLRPDDAATGLATTASEILPLQKDELYFERGLRINDNYYPTTEPLPNEGETLLRHKITSYQVFTLQSQDENYTIDDILDQDRTLSIGTVIWVLPARNNTTATPTLTWNNETLPIKRSATEDASLNDLSLNKLVGLVYFGTHWQIKPVLLTYTPPDRSLDASYIKDLAITGNKFKPNGLDQDQVVDGSIEGYHLKDRTLISIKVALNTLTDAEFLNYTLSSVKLKPNTLEDSSVARFTLTSGEVAPGSIQISRIALGGVLGINIKDGSLANFNVQDDAITEAVLRDLSLITLNIADSAVGSENIQDGTLEREKIMPQSVYGFNIAGAIDYPQIELALATFIQNMKNHPLVLSGNLTGTIDLGTGLFNLYCPECAGNNVPPPFPPSPLPPLPGQPFIPAP